MSFARPGCCPACGTFVAVRRKHAYRCCPQPLPSQEVPWSGRSPMLAWPREHRVVRGGRTWLRSPVPAIGPRLLVLLAQHRSHVRRDLPAGKRARYGPSHALQDLIELPPEQVLDEVLRPAPTWVPCGGTWHPVLLWDGQLTALAHGEIDVEGEQVASLLGRVPLSGCVAAMVSWSGRESALRVPWLERLARFDAAASWGVDELAARDSWIDACVSSGLVSQAAGHGICDVELLRWTGWERDVRRIAAWRDVGWTAREAYRLHGVGITADASRTWRAAGLDVDLVIDAAAYQLSPAAAAAWWLEGFAPRAADALLERAVDVDCARLLKYRLGTAEAVVHAVTAP